MAEDDQPAPPVVYFDADVIVSGAGRLVALVAFSFASLNMA